MLPAFGHLMQMRDVIIKLADNECPIDVWTSEKFRKYFIHRNITIYIYAIDESLFSYDADPLVMSLHLKYLSSLILKDPHLHASVRAADIILYDVQARWGADITQRYKKITCSYAPSFRHSWVTWLPASFHRDSLLYWWSIIKKSIHYVQKHGVSARRDFCLIRPPYAKYHISLIPEYLQPGYVSKKKQIYSTPLLDGLKTGIREKNNERNIIYVSLGTVYGKIGVIEKIIDELVGFNYQIIVSYNGKGLTDLQEKYQSEQVIVKSFVDQENILQSSKLFITHAGTNGVIEALSSQTPMLCFPQAVDQFANAACVKNRSWGIYVSIGILNHSGKLGDKICSMLRDSKKYINAMEKDISQLDTLGNVQRILEFISLLDNKKQDF